MTAKDVILARRLGGGSGGGGGDAITDGIVVKERDAAGYATVVDFYGTEIRVAQFYGGSEYTAAEITPFKHLTTINTKKRHKIHRQFRACRPAEFTAARLGSIAR